jgi:signal transduction histidine kinase
VRLRVDAQEPLVVYTVEDEGSGIEESEVERVFDIYVTKAAGDNRGAGLGLPLSRRLARLLGGELRAVSRPRQGGCFILELPASTVNEETFTKASAGP